MSAEHTQICIGQIMSNIEGFTSLVDVETKGKLFWEEVFPQHAERIVKCWNSHDALLETCWEIVNFCESKDRLNDDGVCPTKAYEKAKAAIAQAEKGSGL